MEKQTRESTESLTSKGRQTRAATYKSKASTTPKGHNVLLDKLEEDFSSATDQLEAETSMDISRGSHNKTYLGIASSAISAASTGNLLDEPNDLSVPETNRSVTPNPILTQKQKEGR